MATNRRRTLRNRKTTSSANSRHLKAKKPTKTSYPAKSNYNTKQSTGRRGQNEQEKAGSSKQEKSKIQEKRLKMFRKHAPQTFLQKLHRAQTQRMVVLGRSRSGSGEEIREEIDVVGSTGNIYTVTIARLPECTCPDHLKGNECKHKVYTLHNVLRAPEHLQYQRAFLTSELDEIFSNAPPIPTDVSETRNDGKRKPIEGECPICYMDLEQNDELVWCKAACGNNMHKSCFEQWVASQQGKAVRCVYCRTEWEMERKDIDKIRNSGVTGDDGYVNVAEQFGMSGNRDYSTYHQPWVRRQFGYG